MPVPAKTVDQKLTTISRPQSDPIAVSIPAGSYTVVQGSFDDAHPTQEEQPNERWYAVFYGTGGAIVGTTATTPDLPLADRTMEWTGGTLVLTGNAVSVVYFHAPGGEGPDSIYPNLLLLTPGGSYPPKPAPEQPKPDNPKPESPKSDGPKATEPNAADPQSKPPAAESAAASVVPVVVPVQVVAAPATSPVAAAPEPTVASTTIGALASPVAEPPRSVEVKGIQVENTAPAAAAASAEIAFTGIQSTAMITASGLLILLGGLLMAFARRRST